MSLKNVIISSLQMHSTLTKNGMPVDQAQCQLHLDHQTKQGLICPAYVPGLTYHFVRKPQKNLYVPNNAKVGQNPQVFHRFLRLHGFD